MIPGWEDHLVGMTVGETRDFDITFPDDYRVEELRGKQAHFDGRAARPAREGAARRSTTSGRASVGEVESVDALRDEIRDALGKRNVDEARHVFGDRIIDFAVSNATVELPEVMIANEVEIMRDELTNRLAQQRIGLEQYLALSKQTPEELIAELRDPATRRVKTLLVLSAIAEKEGIDATDAEIDARDRRPARALRRRRAAPRVTLQPPRAFLPAHDAPQPYTRGDAHRPRDRDR